MKSILVQKIKIYKHSITSTYRLVALEPVKVNLILEQLKLDPNQVKEITLTDRHWQDILKINPEINFELL